VIFEAAIKIIFLNDKKGAGRAPECAKETC